MLGSYLFTLVLDDCSEEAWKLGEWSGVGWEMRI